MKKAKKCKPKKTKCTRCKRFKNQSATDDAVSGYCQRNKEPYSFRRRNSTWLASMVDNMNYLS